MPAQPGRYRPTAISRAVPMADGGTVAPAIGSSQPGASASGTFAIPASSRYSRLNLPLDTATPALAGPAFNSDAAAAQIQSNLGISPAAGAPGPYGGPAPAYGNGVTATTSSSAAPLNNQLGTDPTLGYNTPAGKTTSPVQAADESFNPDARDVSTDLGDISGTNSRRSLEYLQQGQQLEDQAGQQANRYGADYEAARDKGQDLASQIQQTPGYTPEEASQINVDYGKYQTGADDLNKRYLTPEEQAGIRGNANAPADKAAAMSGAIYDTLGTSAQKADQALQGEGQLMGTNLEQEQANLGKAVDPSQLGLSSHFTSNYEMTPGQQQDIVTAAGTTVGNQYRSAESDLERAAAADGNSSPAAIAAAKQRLLDSSAAQSGDAMTQARIGASNAAANRLQTEEGMRVGTAQDIASREQQNAETIGSQAQQAIQTYGQQGLSEADTQRQAALQGVETGGEAAINTAAYADTNASQRAGEIAGNRQQTTADVQNTQFTQGVQTGQLTSEGAQATGNARRQGQQEVLGYQQGEQQMGQQGQQGSTNQQINAYGTKTAAANQAENIATTATADTRDQGIGDKASSGLGSFIGNLEDGGIVGKQLSDDDPMAQPSDTSIDEGANPIGATYNSPKPSLPTRIRTGVTNAIQNMGRYGHGGGGGGSSIWSSATPPDDYSGVNSGGGGGSPSLRNYVTNELAQGVGAGIGAIAGLFEKGGYVSKPTLALIGERGPEMVVPLNRTPSTKLPASTLKTAAHQIGRYGGPHGPIRPMTPMRGSLAAR